MELMGTGVFGKLGQITAFMRFMYDREEYDGEEDGCRGGLCQHGAMGMQVFASSFLATDTDLNRDLI